MIARILKCPMVKKVVPFVLGAAIMSFALVMQQAQAEANKERLAQYRAAAVHAATTVDDGEPARR
ncbi:MAG TPA: hypothetical protein VL026_07215 [Rhizomicrobium sp.]|nr:hypothetical protein [Rhizomicrobium sp.]